MIQEFFEWCLRTAPLTTGILTIVVVISFIVTLGWLPIAILTKVSDLWDAKARP